MEQEQKLKIEEDIVKMLKTVYDPELPVDVYSLGLIYKIDLNDEGHVDIDMTLTAPNCPIADFIFEDVRQKVESVDGVTSATVRTPGIICRDWLRSRARLMSMWGLSSPMWRCPRWMVIAC